MIPKDLRQANIIHHTSKKSITAMRSVFMADVSAGRLSSYAVIFILMGTNGNYTKPSVTKYIYRFTKKLLKTQI